METLEIKKVEKVRMDDPKFLALIMKEAKYHNIPENYILKLVTKISQMSQDEFDKKSEYGKGLYDIIQEFIEENRNKEDWVYKKPLN